MPPVLRKWDSKLHWNVIKGNVKLSPLVVDSAACRRGKTTVSFSCGERQIVQHARERENYPSQASYLREVDSAACRRVKLSFTSQISERGG
jgi:hypothetical protein